MSLTRRCCWFVLVVLLSENAQEMMLLPLFKWVSEKRLTSAMLFQLIQPFQRLRRPFPRRLPPRRPSRRRLPFSFFAAWRWPIVTSAEDDSLSFFTSGTMETMENNTVPKSHTQKQKQMRRKIFKKQIEIFFLIPARGCFPGWWERTLKKINNLPEKHTITIKWFYCVCGCVLCGFWSSIRIAFSSCFECQSPPLIDFKDIFINKYIHNY